MWFEDEASFYCNATVARAWAPRGRRQPHARSRPGTNACWRMAAGLDPVRGRLNYRRYTRIDAPLIGQFYAQLAAISPAAERIYLVMDNWPVHHHPNATNAVAGDGRVSILWLPTYSPWLNPTEKVWKWVRQRFSHMHEDVEDMDQFGQHLAAALDQAGQDPQALLRYTATGKSKLYS
jgi:putative transposase